jgi:hypothetical protein
MPPGGTLLRELAGAVAAVLTLPNTATTRDEPVYLRITRDRGRLVLFAMRRILAGHEIGDDQVGVMAAVTDLRDQLAQLRDDACDYVPELS